MSGQNLRVLVVDDDMMARMTAVQCLKQQGHMADAAEGGRQGLEMLGFEVLRQLKATNVLGRTPVIVVSGADEDESIAKCLEMGASGHLRKPLDPASLADGINACLGSDG
jgi:CheY-like chemotaxis protein